MGQTAVKDQFKFNNLTLTEIQCNVDDSRFGQFKLLQELESKVMIVQKSYNFQTEEEAKQFLKKVDFRIQLSQCPYILPILKHRKFQQNDMCSSMLMVNLFHQFSNITLRKEIDQRMQTLPYQQFFSEIELLLILKSISLGLTYLNENRIQHGCIQPNNIFISKQAVLGVQNTNENKYTFRIHDIQFLTEMDPFTLYISDDKELEKYYVSPELLDALNGQNNTVQSESRKKIHSSLKNDMFSLGMVLLEAATLQPVKACYDFRNFKIHTVELNKLLAVLYSRYSSGVLYNYVKNMLELEQSHRPTPFELIERLESQSDQIKNINFVPVSSESAPLMSQRSLQQSSAPMQNSQPTIHSTSEKQQLTTIRQENEKLGGVDFNTNTSSQFVEPIIMQEQQQTVNNVDEFAVKSMGESINVQPISQQISSINQKFIYAMEQVQRSKERFRLTRKQVNQKEESMEMERLESSFIQKRSQLLTESKVYPSQTHQSQSSIKYKQQLQQQQLQQQQQAKQHIDQANNLNAEENIRTNAIMSQSFKIMPGGAQRESGSFIDGNKFMQMYLDEYKNIVSSSKLVS